MNIKESIKNLKLKIQQKNIIFVTGNVYEEFISEKQKGDRFHIEDLISSIVKDEIGHESVNYYSYDQDKMIDLLEGDKTFEDIDESININKALRKAIENIHTRYKGESSIKAKTYIYDFGDFFMENETGDDVEETLKTLFSASLSFEPKIDTKGTQQKINLLRAKDQTKIIFLMRSAGNIKNSLVNKNVEYAEVIINKPDFEERKELLRVFAPMFKVKDQKELMYDSEALKSVAALTDGMSNREILQLARIKSSIGEEKTFRELFKYSLLRTSESAWEKLDFELMNNIPEFLSKRVYGQEYAIERVAKTIKRSFMGLAGSYNGEHSNKPKGILFFCGPTGVGKTEMAKAITELVFQDQNKMIRFDMSEFSQEHSDQRLLGAPPGYVGFDGGGELTNAIKEKPNSIILFDEIEKAHPRILDKFLQILEDGRLTSSKGELINFSETFIIFTSNIGASEVTPKDDSDAVRDKFKNAVYDKFKGNDMRKGELNRPELLNRIGKENIVPFNFIKDKKIQIKMFTSKLHKQNDILKSKHNVELVWEERALENVMKLLQEKYKPEDGGRGLLEVATTMITDELVEFIIANYNKIEPNLKKHNNENRPLAIEMKAGTEITFEWK